MNSNTTTTDTKITAADLMGYIKVSALQLEQILTTLDSNAPDTTVTEPEYEGTVEGEEPDEDSDNASLMWADLSAEMASWFEEPRYSEVSDDDLDDGEDVS